MNPENTNGWVGTQQDGAVLTVTLDRPDQLNAQTPTTWATLARIGASLDDDVRVVVVRGAGRSFSAGLDRSLFSAEPGVEGGLGDLGRRRTAEADGADPGYQAGFRWLRTPGIVSVAGAGPRASGPAASWRSPATCGSSPTTPSCGCPRRAWASCPT